MESHLTLGGLESRYEAVKERIASASSRAGRPLRTVEVVAVTKTYPLDLARKACALGITKIGENRVQEAVVKYRENKLIDEFPDVRLHLIGHLQRNKVRKALQVFDNVDSLDSLETAEELNSEAEKLEKRVRILLEVNTSWELQKSGVGPVETLSNVEELLKFPRLNLAGLMTVGPFTNREDAIRDSFRLLKQLFEDVKTRLNPPGWSVLSMGMSGDFEIAIEEGATEIRLGTALFGPRSEIT